jgi:hypothetical protein
MKKLLYVVIIGICGTAGYYIGYFGYYSSALGGKQVEQDITIYASQYGYEPPIIHINKGDMLHIKLVSRDVVHGFYVEGYDLDCEIYPQKTAFKVRKPSKSYGWQDAEVVTIKADKAGKFRYRCSHTCGFLHPFMNGELIVRPNLPFWVGSGTAVGMALAGLFIAVTGRDDNNGKPNSGEGK